MIGFLESVFAVIGCLGCLAVIGGAAWHVTGTAPWQRGWFG